ncbi:MAG TPA: hypothetical protein VG276_01535 [Actinomycetes bacterium]|jgi:hypothetical protein|nr:hypothetical protein [Actinomycetes bacterium]
MRPLAHHAGEDSLANLLLLGSGGGLSLLLAIGRARVAAARARLTRKQGSRRRG